MAINKVEDIQNSVIISPNLGQPIFLNINTNLKKQVFQAEILLISNITDINHLKQTIKGHIRLNPILDYKWKLRKIFNKFEKFKNLDQFKIGERISVWLRWKRRRLKKKIKKIFLKESKIDEYLRSIKIESINLQLKKLQFKPYRGKVIVPSISEVKEISITPINTISFLKGISPQHFLLKHEIFGKLNKFYGVTIEFKLTKQIQHFLKDRTFVMFDLSFGKGRVNPHSIVVFNQEWKNFTFIHATDLHLADRNDRIYEIIKEWTESSIKRNLEDFLKKVIKKLKIEKLKEKRDDYLAEIKVPLRKRLINPNNQFRKFIKIMNRKVMNNELSFIVLTGDLVDFTLLSKFSAKIKALSEYKYEDTNWKIFRDIILNNPLKKHYRGLISGEELLCPIITTLGNHDYRPYQYDITWAEMYKKVGLNAAEAIALNEMFSASPITALTKSSLALKGYLSEINSSYDFDLKLGNNLFIFLNSGADSFKNLRDLITGHPSLTGLSSKQIEYLENLINHKIEDGTNTFLFIHGPPVNTGEKRYRINIFNKKGQKLTRIKLNDYKESIIQKLDKRKSKARIDKLFNVKFGCISSNWEKLIKFCKDYCILTLSGHTHTLKEFRLEDPKEKTTVYDAPPFNLRKIENPAAIYYDDYSEIYKSKDLIEMNSRFIVQTPALGLGGYKNPKTAGAYREVIIKDGKLNSFRVKYISR